MARKQRHGRRLVWKSAPEDNWSNASKTKTPDISRRGFIEPCGPTTPWKFWRVRIPAATNLELAYKTGCYDAHISSSLAMVWMSTITLPTTSTACTFTTACECINLPTRLPSYIPTDPIVCIPAFLSLWINKIYPSIQVSADPSITRSTFPCVSVFPLSSRLANMKWMDDGCFCFCSILAHCFPLVFSNLPVHIWFPIFGLELLSRVLHA